MHPAFLRLLGSLGLLLAPTVALAAAPSFTDVPTNHPAFAAAEYLKTKDILQGYDDGTFRPDQPVNRAEVMKIIVRQRVQFSPETLAQTGSSVFSDVPGAAWFFHYVDHALASLRIIDGPPKTDRFYPGRNVTRAEFLKMLFLAYEIDPVTSYGEITYPLADDVTDSTQWYYPYVRYALTASMLTAKNGTLQPGQELTRADIADMLYRFLLYREGKRTQTLLSVMENETLNTLRLIDTAAFDAAEASAARAMLAARGALSVQPENSTVKGSVKTAEAAMALVQSGRSSEAGDTPKAVEYASTAWHLGAKAKEFSLSLNALADHVQTTATKMADQARGME